MGTTVPAQSCPARTIARSIFSSASVVSPNPLFTSTVVVPSSSILASLSRSPAASCFRVDSRTARTVERIPPPFFRISA